MNFDRPMLKAFMESLGEPAFRGDQVFQWIHQHGITDPMQMKNIGKNAQQKLAEETCCDLLTIAEDHLSSDGTRKWLFALKDGNKIETVYIPEKNRGTLCISSQVGCALNCRFCSTGAMGFNRSLSISEVIGQVWMARHLLGDFERKENRFISNVVMMGMGEPLLNDEAVIPAMAMMMDDLGYGLSKYRVTLSTSGVVPKMWELAEKSECALAVSLHAPTDELRDILVPINKKYPLKMLMKACNDFFQKEPKRQVTFEYTMLKGVNDSIEIAKKLAALVKNIPCKINLIPFNTFPGTKYECSDWETIVAFQQTLQSFDLNTTIRKTRGDDVNAACGQLVGDFTDRTRRRTGALPS